MAAGTKEEGEEVSLMLAVLLQQLIHLPMVAGTEEEGEGATMAMMWAPCQAWLLAGLPQSAR